MGINHADVYKGLLHGNVELKKPSFFLKHPMFEMCMKYGNSLFFFSQLLALAA